MRALGVDPGLAATGYGVVESEEGKFYALAAGTIRSPSSAALPERLGLIYRRLLEIVDEYVPDAVAVEEVYLARNVSAAMSTAQVIGVVALLAQGRRLRAYSPREVKKWICGTGGAPKDQMIGMVTHLLDLGDPGVSGHRSPITDHVLLSDHAADALALAMCVLLEEAPE